MLMGSDDAKRTAPIFAAWVLSALLLGGCGVEGTAPPDLTGSPGLEPQANDGGVCPGNQVSDAYKAFCVANVRPECCCDKLNCSYNGCCPEGEQCAPPYEFPRDCLRACHGDQECTAKDP